MMTPETKIADRVRGRIVLVNRYFAPDLSATSQMATDLMRHLAIAGYDVHVVTSRQRYDDPKSRLPAQEVDAGVTVHRVATTRFGRAGLLGRSIDYASFYVTASIKAARLASPGATLIAKTDPPLLSVPLGLVGRLRGARLVNWMQDVFPEIASELGIGGKLARSLSAVLRPMRNRSLRIARLNAVVGQRMRDFVERCGAPSETVAVLPNWADGRRIVPIPRDDNPLRTNWGLRDRFVVGYSGNLGRAHEIATITGAMASLARASPDVPIAWLFIGGGRQYEALEKDVARLGVQNVHFKPYQPLETLALSLGVADVHLVSLRPELEGLIVPSKYYGIAAAGRPAIFIGHSDGEIARRLRLAGCGVTVPAGDGTALGEAILALAADPGRASALGAAARRSFEADDERTVALTRWTKALDAVMSQG